MPGGNPSADSEASTDPKGDATASPFRAICLASNSPYRERHQSAKSWGRGGKAPAGLRQPPKLLLVHGRSLIMH
jgi:hypothetical protein